VNAMSFILEHGKSPADWCAIFAEKGLDISERNLRQKARELGACHVLGKAMIITPDQIDRILEEACSPRTLEAQHGGPKGASNIMGSRSPATSGKALAHLQKLARPNGSRSGSRQRSAASF
jgi:hypothetical protein